MNKSENESRPLAPPKKIKIGAGALRAMQRERRQDHERLELYSGCPDIPQKTRLVVRQAWIKRYREGEIETSSRPGYHQRPIILTGAKAKRKNRPKPGKFNTAARSFEMLLHDWKLKVSQETGTPYPQVVANANIQSKLYKAHCKEVRL